MNAVRIENATRRCNPYGGFRTSYDRLLLEAFRSGFELHQGHSLYSTELWLHHPEQPQEQDLLIRDGNNPAIGGQPPSVSSVGVADFLRIGRKLDLLDRKVVSAGGLRSTTAYVFDPVLAQYVESQWEEVARAIAARKGRTPLGTPAMPEQLSPLALSLLKRLLPEPGETSPAGVYPYPELLPALHELDQQDLLELVEEPPSVVFRLRQAYRSLRLPNVQRLALLMP